jgi:hypothetical protein
VARNFIDTVDRMLAEIPEDEEDLRAELLKRKEHAALLVAERQQDAWVTTRVVLSNYIGDEPRRESWQERVMDIFVGYA